MRLGGRSRLICIYYFSWAFIITAAIPHPTRSAPCIRYESSNYGFGSNILGLLLTVTAHNHSSNTYFDETEWKYKCDGISSWSRFFSGPTPKQIGFGVSPPKGCLSIQYEGSDVSGHDILKDEDPQKVFNMMRRSVQKVWQLSSPMRRKADAQAAYLRTLKKPLIGITIRGGDKAFEDNLWAKRASAWYQERDWATKLKTLLHQNGYPRAGGTCIIYSDDLKAMYEATKVVKGQLNCFPVQMGGWDGGYHREAWETNAMSHATDPKVVLDEYCSATSDIILQLEALGMTDIFVGSYNSNLARLIHLLRFHVFGKPEQSGQDVLNAIKWHHDYRYESMASVN